MREAITFLKNSVFFRKTKHVYQNMSFESRSSCSLMFFKTGENFAIFTGKHPCWSLFLITLQTVRTPCFTEHVLWLLLWVPKSMVTKHKKGNRVNACSLRWAIHLKCFTPSLCRHHVDFLRKYSGYLLVLFIFNIFFLTFPFNLLNSIFKILSILSNRDSHQYLNLVTRKYTQNLNNNCNLQIVFF